MAALNLTTVRTVHDISEGSLWSLGFAIAELNGEVEATQSSAFLLLFSEDDIARVIYIDLTSSKIIVR